MTYGITPCPTASASSKRRSDPERLVKDRAFFYFFRQA
jgi:hypothetical protein